MFTLTRITFLAHKAKLSDPFKSIRVYKELTNLQLLNALMVNRAANTKWLVANSGRLYKLSSTLFSSRLTNWIIKSTFGKVFTAGETTEDVSAMMDYFQKMGIPVIIDFSGEGFINQSAIEGQLDKNAEMFRRTAEVATKYQNQMISVKITALVDVPTLRKLNVGRENIRKFWDSSRTGEELTGIQMLEAFQRVDGSVTQSDVSKFIQQVFGKDGDIGKFRCDKTEFLMNYYPYYILEKKVNSNKLVKLMCPLSQQEVGRIENMIRRLNAIFEEFYQNSSNFRITVDAEQSYLQEAINSIAQQYQAKYNTNNTYLIPTLQNYLKNANERMDYEIEIANRRNLYFGAKHVRGAYLVEQRRLAEENGTENPIVESFEETTSNYFRNTKLGLSDTRIKRDSEMIIASHNHDTILEIQSFMESNLNGCKLEFAQLQGLADHLTILLHKKGYHVYKYLPFGATETIVPYLIRRAQELSQMRYPLVLQYELIVDELRTRLGLQS